ncbi:MAG: Asp-tRNA(Asn)/Glu-tRNA(Gln) amidotransferase subunit GatC [Candidatus Omnitrophica bacterium]|nr:Asp-tRNA(Asn)/Glu-tRNA(Gln) amidotransferase subunit GatC [Candidatus Omnitrophota bacterium]MBU1127520.1 Asp-tRNA(Asn)/Glu-tRNA(Gln) amidotransferase subunit GatC [Candidatus Omnitrophota bacterium]MBU1657319.1 Asp-tRNA(Asn)/Glu-tRNA(Gln) amidotransferase subunit GatC [Candidatus Omnitrophota bacterium]MBU1783812.1 Asp-tRNA(Asn)/Glu-tRNA(Gln) amidotransferase subunit GatC [Candidatus Omnitrophota bacterium]MBU1851411.1 Asp-tRNA(Asn)/Glu-tRNA(Gln) amidotransferase subunit GatC [Candidatus Om
MNANNINNNPISTDVVKYVAELSRLSLDEKDTITFQHQLARILEYIAQLNEVDTDSTPPTTHVLPTMKDVFREDVPGGSLSQKEALDAAPDSVRGFFRVPRVI